MQQRLLGIKQATSSNQAKVGRGWRDDGDGDPGQDWEILKITGGCSK